MDVDHEIARLEGVASAELRERWRRLTATPAPRVSPKMLRLALAWELQAKAYGGLTRETARALAQLERGLSRTSPAQPGMRLVREWGGKAHVITIDEGSGDGGDAGTIRWDGREWRSLSEVARAITGTRWSGPAFFGLKRRVAA